MWSYGVKLVGAFLVRRGGVGVVLRIEMEGCIEMGDAGKRGVSCVFVAFTTDHSSCSSHSSA